jgi:hypothetical protein
MASQDGKTPPRPDPVKGWGPTPPLAPTPATESAATQRDEAKAEGGEIGGPKGPEPTRYNDWEQKGRCSDF